MKPGTKVYIYTRDKEGVVQKISPNGKRARVRIGERVKTFNVLDLRVVK